VRNFAAIPRASIVSDGKLKALLRPQEGEGSKKTTPKFPTCNPEVMRDLGLRLLRRPHPCRV